MEISLEQTSLKYYKMSVSRKIKIRVLTNQINQIDLIKIFPIQNKQGTFVTTSIDDNDCFKFIENPSFELLKK